MCVKMADGDSDVPPLEDMTEVLKQANAIREHLDKADEGKKKNTQKSKAKVNKKHPTARAVPSAEIKDETLESPKKEEGTKNDKGKSESHSVTDNAKPVPKPSKDAGGLFGGMKKGFLFGGNNKPSAKPPSSSTHSNKNEKDGKNPSEAPANKISNVPKERSEEMPYITPKEKTESGLTFNEVQQAMSEAKGLLDNQEWITDDFLNKIEKNDFLLKRFSDPQFMTALQEFQASPEAAMAKYKGNKEVEKFLTEFCGLLGDHFTNLGATEGNQTKTSSSDQKVTPKVQVPKQNKTKTQAKIVELDEDESNLTDNQTSPADSISPLDNLTNVNKQRTGIGPNQDIKIHNVENKADIQEVKSSSDEEVKDILNDPKVMETLMDPQIMKLIQSLKEDPAKGQRIVNEANADLRSKIQFLVSKGLLQFQI